jgi:hypothetical protein
MKQQHLDKLENMLGADIEAAKQNLMVKQSDGSYYLFGMFTVVETRGKITVHDCSQRVLEFSSIKSAVGWCIAKKYQEYTLANEIQQLDRNMAWQNSTALILTATAANIKDPDRKLIAIHKREDANHKTRTTKTRLQKCLSRAKYLQIRGFNDEIARTRRQAPTRSSRTSDRKSIRQAD